MADISNFVPPKDLDQQKLDNVFDHLYHRLAAFRNEAQLYATLECQLSSAPEKKKTSIQDEFITELQKWAQDLLENAYVWLGEPGSSCPKLDFDADTATRHLPPLPSDDNLQSILNGILLLHVTQSKEYSARTRAFLRSFGPFDEYTVVSTLKNPEQALEAVRNKTDAAKDSQNAKNKTWRIAGMAAAAIGGGVLVGVTGGLAAPLIGGVVSSLFGVLGLGGTAASLLASGLAGSGVVCGALFGAYGAHSTASMVERHTQEVSDLSVVPVREQSKDETLAVRLCVTGWLSKQEDVWEPWTIFQGDDTFALQWEVKALMTLSDSLYKLMASKAMSYVRGEILSRTLLASVSDSSSPNRPPQYWPNYNPWMNARALSLKTGRVLGDLLAQRAFGNRPVSLCGFSLGALVIFEALKYLATLPPSQTIHLIQDVYLFGTPTSNGQEKWSSVRRVVSGRLVNGYSNKDYVLAVLSRASNASWEQAGLTPVQVKGVENVLCDRVDGHASWRGLVGECLRADVKIGMDALK
ncbi:DUF726-domain-containing protein [Flagelloscypha sp. PMI_526]|nr:DUF726-domain-containing protein [Flagelloscypha sp. PMI_526]